MSDPRICIVGAGGHATRRIYPYIAAAGARLVGVCDLDEEKARRNAGRFGGNAYTDMQAMLDAERPDGVMVYIGQKPPAPDAAAALELARLSRRTGVLCTTAFKKRYSLAYARAKEFIESFPPEGLLCLSVVRASGRYSNESARSDLLLDFGIHGVDLMSYLGGEARRVFAFTADFHAYAVSIRFACGAVGSFCLNDGRSFQIPTEEVEITLAGGNFMSIHNSACWRIARANQPDEWREPPTFTAAGDSGNETGHLAEIADFVAAIQEGRSTRSNIHESYKSMILYEAVRASARTGRPVAVQYESP
ncbi:MAG: hypothetical protein AMJ81_11915 [Phycisphaerae bacterium SM23_33]|nr:MAG: hypothetical protein AMJ81_11915 [Phycisphaerae bacterium SM23_33]